MQRGWMTVVGHCVISGLVSILTACSPAEKGGMTALPTLTPKPGAIKPISGRPETRATASALISVAKGGTVTATGGDGTRYTLAVPALAVTQDVTVTITPMTDVSGGIGDGTRHVVRMEPDGLEFLTPATLTVAPKSALKQALYFTQAKPGDVPQPLFVSPKPGHAVMLVNHFSMAGELGVNDSAIDSAFGVLAGDQLEMARRDLAITSQKARNAALLSDVDAPEAQAYVEQSIQYRELIQSVILMPALERMATTPTRCSDAQTIAAAVVEFAKQDELTGGSVSVDMVRAVKAAHSNCEKQEITLCKQTGNLSRLVSLWILQARELQLLGEAQSGDYDFVERADRICRISYDAAGGADDFHGTGTICSLAKPFTISGSGVTVNFTPTSITGGSYKYSGSMGIVRVYGHGTYKVSADEQGGTITATGPGTVVTPLGSSSATDSETYTLTRRTPGC